MARVRLIIGAALALIGAAAPASSAEPSHAGMILAPAGLYTPFLRVKPASAAAPTPANVVSVPGFWLDVEPVTNSEFLDFVQAHPQWRKSEIKAVFADERYLQRWPGDLELIDAEARDEPVTNVSWFAAQAYCRARGLRLPTTDQWEYALADDGRDQSEVRARFLEWLAHPNPARPASIGAGKANGFGLRDMVGLVWEWTRDFDAFATTAESRDANGKDAALTCGAASAGASDLTDYAGFMRFSLRSSLKADYTADNVGFRCAGDL